MRKGYWTSGRRRQLRWTILLGALAPLGQGCATTSDPPPARAGAPLPRLFSASPESRIGGQARFDGYLQVRNGCVIVTTETGHIVPIFDSSIRLTQTGDAIVDSRNGLRIAVGERLWASAAYARDHGVGWSYPEIEKAMGVRVLEECGDTVVRLKSVRREELEPRPGRNAAGLGTLPCITVE